MSKLFKLKEWLTLADAAQHLTIVFGEDVTEADLLRFALDGHLKLSVNFVNHAKAKPGRIVSWEETEWFMCSPIVTTPIKNQERDKTPETIFSCPPKLKALLEEMSPEDRLEQVCFMKSLKIDDERFLNMGNEVETIMGVWDLPMIGTERLDIEHAYQNLTGGPAVTLQSIDGAFVQNSHEQMYQLQESFDDNEFQSGSQAGLEQLKAKIVNEKIKKPEANRLLNQHKEERKKYLEARKSKPKYMDYYPASGLPEDSVLVVRTAALREFERKITETEEQVSEKPLSTTERNSLLTIIGLIVKDGYGDDLRKPYTLAKEIQKTADLLSIKISDDTIASKLKDAKKVLDEKHE